MSRAAFWGSRTRVAISKNCSAFRSRQCGRRSVPVGRLADGFGRRSDRVIKTRRVVEIEHQVNHVAKDRVVLWMSAFLFRTLVYKNVVLHLVFFQSPVPLTVSHHQWMV